MKSFFDNPNGQVENKDAEELYKYIDIIMHPIFQRYITMGYRVEDISFLIQRSVNSFSNNLIAQKAMKEWRSGIIKKP